MDYKAEMHQQQVNFYRADILASPPKGDDNEAAEKNDRVEYMR